LSALSEYLFAKESLGDLDSEEWVSEEAKEVPELWEEVQYG